MRPQVPSSVFVLFVNNITKECVCVHACFLEYVSFVFKLLFTNKTSIEISTRNSTYNGT